jgi:hypothetical protein
MQIEMMGPRRRMPATTPPGTVAVGILPAVESGILPGGIAARIAIKSKTSGLAPGGKRPPSTAGRMPATTWLPCQESVGGAKTNDCV